MVITLPRRVWLAVLLAMFCPVHAGLLAHDAGRTWGESR